MSRRTRGSLTVEEVAELKALPVLKRRHPSRFLVSGWTSEMRRQIVAAGRLGAPCMSENCD